MPSYESWSDYHAVWHLDDTSDDSNNSYDTSSVGTVTTGDPGLIGGALSLSSSGYLSATNYKGVLTDEVRAISLWLRSVDTSGPLLVWGDNTDRWEISWETNGPKVMTGGGATRQGIFSSVSN